jgi:hypothetical protein
MHSAWCTCTYMYMCMHNSTCACLVTRHVHVHVHMCSHTDVHAHVMHMHMTCTCTCTYAYVYVCAHDMCMHMHMCTCSGVRQRLARAASLDQEECAWPDFCAPNSLVRGPETTGLPLSGSAPTRGRPMLAGVARALIARLKAAEFLPNSYRIPGSSRWVC